MDENNIEFNSDPINVEGEESFKDAMNDAVKTIDDIRRASDRAEQSLQKLGSRFDEIEEKISHFDEDIKESVKSIKKLDKLENRPGGYRRVVNNRSANDSNRRAKNISGAIEKAGGLTKKGLSAASISNTATSIVKSLGTIAPQALIAVTALNTVVTALDEIGKSAKTAQDRTTQYSKSLNQLGKQMTEQQKNSLAAAESSKKLNNQMSEIKNNFGSVLGDIKGSIDGFLSDVVESITGISGETENKVAVAGVQANIVSDAKQTGLPAELSRQMASDTYSMAEGLAIGGEQASDVAEKLADAWLNGSDAAKEFGIVLNDTVLTGYLAEKGIDIANTEITDAMKQYYRYLLLEEQVQNANSDYLQANITRWTKLGTTIDKTKGKLFAFDEVINLDGFSNEMPDSLGDGLDRLADAKEEELKRTEPLVANIGSMIADIADLAADLTNEVETRVEQMEMAAQNAQQGLLETSNQTQQSLIETSQQAMLLLEDLHSKSTEGIEKATETAQETISETHTDVENSIAETSNTAVEAIEMNSNAALESISTAAEVGVNNITEVSNTASEQITNETTSALERMLNYGNQVLEALKQRHQQLMQESQELTSTVMEEIGEVSNTAEVNISNTAAEANANIQSTTSTAFNGISAEYSNTANSILSNSNTANNSIEEVASNALMQINSVGSQVASSLSNAFQLVGGIAQQAEANLRAAQSQTSISSQTSGVVSQAAQNISQTASNVLTQSSSGVSSSSYKASSSVSRNKTLPSVISSSNSSGKISNSSSMALLNDGLSGLSTSKGHAQISNISSSSSISSSISSVGSLTSGNISKNKYGIVGMPSITDIITEGADWLNKYTDDSGKVDWYGAFTEGLPSMAVNSVKFATVDTIDRFEEEYDRYGGGALGFIMGLGRAGAAFVGEGIGDFAELSDLSYKWGLTGTESLYIRDGLQLLSDMFMGEKNVEELSKQLDDLFTTRYVEEKRPYSGDVSFADRIKEAQKRNGYADGGIGTRQVTGATLFEDNKKEAVIPLESERGIGFMADAMEKAGLLAGAGTNGDHIEIHLTLSGINVADNDAQWEEVGMKLAEVIDIQRQRRGELSYGSSF